MKTRASEQNCLDRRHFISSGAMNLGAFGLASLLQTDRLRANPAKPEFDTVQYDLRPKRPPREPRAKAMISIFTGGGPSQMDLFDPKPLLNRLDGQEAPESQRKKLKFDNGPQSSFKLLGSPFAFSKYGQSGMDFSELLPHMAGIADEFTMIRSMELGGLRNHVAGILAMNMGRNDKTRPPLGSWLAYGLGAETENLPAFVALQTRPKLPPGSPYWSSGFLPSIYQGTMVRYREPYIANLDPPLYLNHPAAQQGQLSYLKNLNRAHLQKHPHETDLEARIQSYELAARMQLSAKEVFDLSDETAETKRLYGFDDPALKNAQRFLPPAFLIARRLIERGVRFVQIWNYGWDMHESIFEVLPDRCVEADKPTAGLIIDLKRRGLLDSTIVHWGGEMGRLPVVQTRRGATPGRDHNTDGFTTLLAGGGFKPGCIHGTTDEFGHFAVEDPVHHSDYHATLLHQFGLDAKALTFAAAGREQSLIDNQSGEVVANILS